MSRPRAWCWWIACAAALAVSPPAWARGEAPGDWRELARELKAPGAEVELPCLLYAYGRCTRHGLSSFFGALQSEPSAAPVRVVVLGNSLIAADGVVGVVRERLVERFGDGGRGFVLADRLGPWGPRDRTGLARGKWGLSTVGMFEPLQWPHGLSGAQHQVLSRGASTQYALRGETHAEVLWFSPDGTPGMRVEVDGVHFASFFPPRSGARLRTEVTLPESARTLKLSFAAAGPVVQGIVLERERGGLVLDTFGVPSVDASLYLRTDEPLFVEQLRQRAPALVVVMLGGNEVKRLSWGKAELPTVERDLRALLRRTRQAAPDASCLVVSPLDSVRGPGARRPFQQRPQLAPYLALQRRVARDEQCGYFDLFAAMGGAGSLKRFSVRGLLHEDLVHPRGEGLELLGELMALALLRAWDDRDQLGAPANPATLGERAR